MIRLLGRLLLIFALLAPVSVFARGGGGCLEAGTPILTPNGWVPIEKLKLGDNVVSIENGRVSITSVAAVIAVDADEFYEISATAGGKKPIMVRFTGEHPISIGQGKFKEARRISKGETIQIFDSGEVLGATVIDLKTVPQKAKAYNLLVHRAGTFLARGIVVHNKGCFLPDTPVALPDGTSLPISEIAPGQKVLAFDGEENVVPAIVREVLKREAPQYLEVRTSGHAVKVTPEHPFFIGKGEFKNASDLELGEIVFILTPQGLSPEKVESIDAFDEAVTVYNLQTEEPHTFFAHGFAVHNKGGGGCFGKGTLIETPDGPRAIESLKLGDSIYSIDNGKLIASKIKSTHKTSDTIEQIEFENGKIIRTTPEHPLKLFDGKFLPAFKLATGQEVMFWDGVERPLRIKSIDIAPITEPVFNLSVDEPHTFIADGVIAHNKGGFGGGRGGRGGKPLPPPLAWTINIAMIGFVLWSWRGGLRRSGELDYVFPNSKIKRKAEKTQKLIEFISKQDSAFEKERLIARVKMIFLKLQECWQFREYQPMEDLLFPDLYRQHTLQLKGMKLGNEINKIDTLSIKQIDLVNVRYTNAPHNREFTALITASARDYYVDSRSGQFLRGDSVPQTFQEFWVFQPYAGEWRLREIEQTSESRALKEENFFEQFTDRQLGELYGDDPENTGGIGPDISRGQSDKSEHIERLLNFLVQTDKTWSREKILGRARQIFSTLMLGLEAGDLSSELEGLLLPELAKSFREQLANWKLENFTVQFRNFCIRKADIVLVRNLNDDLKDECMVRIDYHAQEIWQREGLAFRSDQYVTAGTRYLSLVKRKGEWILSELVEPAAGATVEKEASVDEGSSPEMMKWFYSKKRAD